MFSSSKRNFSIIYFYVTFYDGDQKDMKTIEGIIMHPISSLQEARFCSDSPSSFSP